MRVKISSLKSFLSYENQLSGLSLSFIGEIEKTIHSKLDIVPLGDYDCDLKLIYIETGGTEGIFLDNISRLKEPYYLLTNGSNNSLAASLEIMTYLNIHHLQGEIIHGDLNYVCQRIVSLSALKKEEQILPKLGIFGKPSDWLISSIPSYVDVEKTFGVKLIDISLKEIEDNYKHMRGQIDTSDIKGSFSNEEKIKAKKIYSSFKNVCDKYALEGFTVRCFDLLTSLKSTGCIGLAFLNDLGIISTCEGDVMAMLTMYLIKKHFNQISFQANPSRINTKENSIVFAHCTIPTSMCKTYSTATHFESGIGIAIKGELFTKDVTILRISSDLKHYFVSNGKIIENLNETNLCRTQIKVELEEDVTNILHQPCGNHHIIFYGHHKDEIIEILKFLN